MKTLADVLGDTTPNSENVNLFGPVVDDPKPYYSLIFEHFSLLGIVQAFDHILIDLSLSANY